MIGTPLTFKGFLAKTNISEDLFKKFLNKIEDMRKMSQIAVYMEMYHTCIAKQCQLLQSQINNEMNDDKRYYLQFTMIFQAVSINLQHFNCTLDTNLKQYHLCNCMELDDLTTLHLDSLMNSYKKYKIAQDGLFQSAKKWQKNEKQLSQSIKIYNESFVDPKLVYNTNQINKRYLHCSTTYHNAIKQQVNLKEKLNKLLQSKLMCVNSHNKCISQCMRTYCLINQKIIMQAKNSLSLFCSVHKMLVSDIASKKKGFQEAKIKPFLFSVPEMQNEAHFFNISQGQKSIQGLPIFLQKPEAIKNIHLKLYPKWLLQYGQYLKECGDHSRKLMKKIHGFLTQTIKIIEKMSHFMAKQIPISFEKMKKKMIEMFGQESFNYIKTFNSTIETSVKIYQKLVKISYQKLQNMTNYINDNLKMAELFFRQYNKQQQLYNYETKNAYTADDTKQIRMIISQKSEIIKYYIKSFGEKITKNNDFFKTDIKNIIHEILSSLNQIFFYSSEFQQTNFGVQSMENITKIKDDIISRETFIQLIPENIANQSIVIEQSERFKYAQFQKIKRVGPQAEKQEHQALKTLNSMNSFTSIPQIGTNQESAIRRSVSVASIKKMSLEIDSKEKKNFDFLSKKIVFEQDQQFKRAFKCALYDKILLQGKLFVTDKRLAFHSYFNTANIFFGGTFIVIPKKDILKAQKRHHAKIFDNSVSITTVNGQVFFTTFFSRDEAFNQIVKTFDLKVEEEIKEQEQEQKNEQDKEQNNIQQNQNQAQQVEVIEAENDDINKQQLTLRAEKLQQVSNNKMSQLGTAIIKSGNCLYLLKKYFALQEYTHKDKKYNGFYKFYKESIGQYDIVLERWEPNIEAYLNKNNIKSNTPLSFSRRCQFNHTLPKSGIPFMPKFCTSEQFHTMTIISVDKFFIDFKVLSRGVPYADTFILYSRQEYTNTTNGVQIITYFKIQFLKKSLAQGFIQKQSNSDMKQNIQRYGKFLNKTVTYDPYLKKKKITKKLEGNTSTNDQLEQQQKAQQQQQQQQTLLNKEQPLQTKYASLLKSHEQLVKKQTLYRNIIIGLIILNIIFMIW